MAANGAGNTFCPSCNETVIQRNRYDTRIVALDKKGNCTKCGQQVIEYV